MEKEPPDLSYYKCVKTSLKSIAKNDFVITKINDTTVMANKIVIHSLQFLKLYLIYLYDNNEKLPIINKQFINSILKTVCSSSSKGRPPSETTKGIKDTLKIFYDLHYGDLQGEELNYVHMNTILDYLCIDIITMYENNIKQHFIDYIERYVNVVWKKKAMLKLIKKKYKTPNIQNKYVNKLCIQLRNIKDDIINNERSKKSSKIYHSWIDNDIKHLLPNKKFQKDSVYYDLMCSPQDYLPNMFYMMKKVEDYGESLNNICPLRSDVIPKYIRIDTTTLVHLLFTKKEGNKGYYTTKGNLVENQYKIWKFFFKTEKKCFHLEDNYNYKFHHMIETDGIGCSILLLRKDLVGKKIKSPKVSLNTEKYIDELTENDYDNLKNKNIVAIDPNLSDLVYCINDKGNKFRYTQDQRRKETKAKKYRNILQENKINTIIDDKNIVDYETELSHYNKKTLEFIGFKEYIKHKNKVNIKISNFYAKYIYRKLKLNSYINRKKTEIKMLNRFESIFGKPSDTIIGFGDYEQYKHRKYKEPVKGKGFRTLFRKTGYKVYLVDEFRTSCRCSSCEGECKTFRECENPRPWKNNRIIRHGLIKCKTCLGLWNRDTNASRNILHIVKNEITRKGRPEYLRRTKSSISGTTSVSD